MCSLYAILADLLSRFLERPDNRSPTFIESENYAVMAREVLKDSYDEVSLNNMQCYLMLSIHEIGHGREHRGWMQLGQAIRISQALKLQFEDTFEKDDWIKAETHRRTFWCCFILDRLVSNGKDRPSCFQTEYVTTHLPTEPDDFIFGRKAQSTPLQVRGEKESLLARTIRIIDILGGIVCWNGAGGRHRDARAPWMNGMPFENFRKRIEEWNNLLPEYMMSNRANQLAHNACGQGYLFALMHLFSAHAKCYLYREYFPFIPPIGYDPANGPCDGPSISYDYEPANWWRETARAGMECARQISLHFSDMVEMNLVPWAFPFSGFCLLTAASYQVFCSLRHWESASEFTGIQAGYLLVSMLEHMMKFREVWPLAAHWV